MRDASGNPGPSSTPEGTDTTGGSRPTALKKTVASVATAFSVVALFISPVSLATALFAGGVQTSNPRDGDPAAIQAGGALFRERCADCHGADAKGTRGPDLTRLWTAEGSDQRVFRTIRSGVPGSIMPSSPAPDDEIWAIVAYLRNVSTVRREESSGNIANGERLFGASCASCHRVNGRGGRLGPDLSRIAASQSNQVLSRAI